MKHEKNYLKSLIGTQVIDLNMNRKGIIRSIAFHSRIGKYVGLILNGNMANT